MQNPNLALNEISQQADRELSIVSIDLQHLITELDFNGESGDQLSDIRHQTSAWGEHAYPLN